MQQIISYTIWACYNNIKENLKNFQKQKTLTNINKIWKQNKTINKLIIN